MFNSSSRSTHPQSHTTLEPQFNETPTRRPRRHDRPHAAPSTTDLSVPGPAGRNATDRRPRPNSDVFLNRQSKWIILKLAGWGKRHAGRLPIGGKAVEKRVTDGS